VFIDKIPGCLDIRASRCVLHDIYISDRMTVTLRVGLGRMMDNKYNLCQCLKTQSAISAQRLEGKLNAIVASTASLP